jgi:hypothetical protein
MRVPVYVYDASARVFCMCAGAHVRLCVRVFVCVQLRLRECLCVSARACRVAGRYPECWCLPCGCGDWAVNATTT